MIDLKQLIANRKAMLPTSIDSGRSYSNLGTRSSSKDAKTLATEANQLKRSLLNQKQNYYNGELAERQANTGNNAAERKDIEAELSAVTRELASLAKLEAKTDQRSARVLESEIERLHQEFKSLNTLKKIDSVEDTSNQLAAEQAKPASAGWVYTYDSRGRVAGQTWVLGRNETQITNLTNSKNSGEAELQETIIQSRESLKFKAKQISNTSSTEKSRKAAEKLNADLKATTNLSVTELAKIQVTLTQALPTLKSSMGKKELEAIKTTLAAMNPNQRNQLNQSLALGEILESINTSKTYSSSGLKRS